MRFLFTHLVTFATTVLLVLSIIEQVIFACPPSGYMPVQTFRDQMEQEDVTVIASLDSSKAPNGIENDNGSSTFTIVKVLSTSTKSTLKPGDVIQKDRYEAGEIGDLFLMTGICQNNHDVNKRLNEDRNPSLKRIETSHLAASDFLWNSPLPASSELVSYLEGISPTMERVDQLRYFQEYLESPNPHVADDAFSEISRLSYDELVAFSLYMNPEKLRDYINNKNTNITRIGHYGVMLGLSGDASDARMLEERIRLNGESFRVGIDGLMKGYLLLARENGISLLIETKIRPLSDLNSGVPFSEGYAAIQALRFAADEMGEEQIGQEKVNEAMRLVLDCPELADLVIPDLARWEDWSIADRLVEMFHDECFHQHGNQKAIVIYFMTLLDADMSKPSHPDDATIEKANTFIEEVQTSKPGLLRHARNLYR
jgi:hypothetical protein